MSPAKFSAVCLALGSLLSATPARAAETGVTPTKHNSYTARVVTPTVAYAAPDSASRVRMLLSTQTQWTLSLIHI